MLAWPSIPAAMTNLPASMGSMRQVRSCIRSLHASRLSAIENEKA
jgi:hypothetical protein